MALPGLLPSWWTWRLSAQARLASLLLLWALILFEPRSGALLWPLVALRLAFSASQMVWNGALGRRHPLESRTVADWCLFGVTFVLACVASEVGKVVGDARQPLLLACVALPYSVIQLRTCRRSLRAAERADFLASRRGDVALQMSHLMGR